MNSEWPFAGVIVEECSHIDAFGGYEKSLTRRFFGLGPDTQARDETSYLDEVSDLGVRGELALPQAGGNWIATIGARGEYHNLGPGRVSGRPTTDDVFPELFAAGDHPVRTCRCPHLHAALVVALNTGMRRAEVMGLTWDRIDLSRGVLQLETTKSGRRREIPMNRAVYGVLATLPRSGVLSSRPVSDRPSWGP